MCAVPSAFNGSKCIRNHANLLLEALNVLHLRLGDRLHRSYSLCGDVRGLGDRAI